jgi:integrase/recombinase XerD
MKQARTLNEAELKLVMAHCATRRHAARDRAIVMVSFHLGLRAKEIAALTVSIGVQSGPPIGAQKGPPC